MDKARRHRSCQGGKMTLKELSQVYWLNKELETETDRLRKAQAKGDDDLSEAIAEIILNKVKRIKKEKEKIEAFIDTIPDSLTRQIFVERFIKNKSWTQIAIKFNIEQSTARKRVYNFLKK